MKNYAIMPNAPMRAHPNLRRITLDNFSLSARAHLTHVVNEQHRQLHGRKAYKKINKCQMPALAKILSVWPDLYAKNIMEC